VNFSGEARKHPTLTRARLEPDLVADLILVSDLVLVPDLVPDLPPDLVPDQVPDLIPKRISFAPKTHIGFIGDAS